MSIGEVYWLEGGELTVRIYIGDNKEGIDIWVYVNRRGLLVRKRGADSENIYW